MRAPRSHPTDPLRPGFARYTTNVPIFNGWLIRALAVRLRKREMRTQRRFLALTCGVLGLFLAWALWYLAQQPSIRAREQAALVAFAALAGVMVGLIGLAVVVRKRTGTVWTTEEALRDAGIDPGRLPQKD